MRGGATPEILLSLVQRIANSLGRGVDVNRVRPVRRVRRLPSLLNHSRPPGSRCGTHRSGTGDGRGETSPATPGLVQPSSPGFPPSTTTSRVGDGNRRGRQTVGRVDQGFTTVPVVVAGGSVRVPERREVSDNVPFTVDGWVDGTKGGYTRDQGRHYRISVSFSSVGG